MAATRIGYVARHASRETAPAREVEYEGRHRAPEASRLEQELERRDDR